MHCIFTRVRILFGDDLSAFLACLLACGFLLWTGWSVRNPVLMLIRWPHRLQWCGPTETEYSTWVSESLPETGLWMRSLMYYGSCLTFVYISCVPWSRQLKEESLLWAYSFKGWLVMAMTAGNMVADKTGGHGAEAVAGSLYRIYETKKTN